MAFTAGQAAQQTGEILSTAKVNMKKVPAIVIAIVVTLSCVPWLRHQHYFSLLIGATAIVLAGFMVFRFLLWISNWQTLRQSISGQFKWRLPISRKQLWMWVIFLVLISTVPHFVTTLSGDYRLAVATAHQSLQFNEALGAPVKEGWLSQGKSTFQEPIRSERLIHVSGTKRKGNLRVLALKEDGQWKLLGLTLELERPDESIESINLLAAGNADSSEGRQ